MAKPVKTPEDKIDEILMEADDACEGANYHDRVGLAGDIYAAIKNLIREENRVKVARAIAKMVSP